MNLDKIVYKNIIPNPNPDKHDYPVEYTIFVDTIKNYRRQLRVIADIRSVSGSYKIETVYDESQDLVTTIPYVANYDKTIYSQEDLKKEYTFHMDHYETDERAYEMLLEILTTSFEEYMKWEGRRL